ncbi:MAG: hypothetical protein ABW032_11465 [Burkholderiaceae bacterium]
MDPGFSSKGERPRRKGRDGGCEAGDAVANQPRQAAARSGKGRHAARDRCEDECTSTPPEPDGWRVLRIAGLPFPTMNRFDFLHKLVAFGAAARGTEVAR